MVDPFADWWVHTITARPYLGRTGTGAETYGPTVTLTGFVADKRRLVRDSTGAQVVSETTVALPAGSPTLPPGSKVTLPGIFGRTATVIVASVGDTGGLLDVDHIELALL